MKLPVVLALIKSRALIKGLFFQQVAILVLCSHLQKGFFCKAETKISVTLTVLSLQVLGKSSAESAFRPWWDKMSDYIL